MISLVCKAAQEAGARSQKRITAAHLKQAIAKDEQFDFLQDIIAKVPDAPAAGEKTEEGEDGADSKKKKVGRRKRKVSDDI
jgi:Dr1-associated corepressor